MKILMVFAGMFEDLPPLFTAAISMSELGAEVSIVCAGMRESSRSFVSENRISIFALDNNSYPSSKISKLLLKLNFLRLLYSVIHTLGPDVLWFHSAHAMFFKRMIRRKTVKIIVAHCHEIYDDKKLYKYQRNAVSSADFFIAPEINRAWLIKVSANTAGPFYVIPNRLPSKFLKSRGGFSNVKKTFGEHGGSRHCEQFIIYQGLISQERCVSQLILAFKEVSDPRIGLIILGDGVDQAYIHKVKTSAKEDDRIVFLSKIPSPAHLEITSGCSIGVILYAPTSLNNIYCAPNKLYEYSYYGLAIIMPDYPGLRQVNAQYNLGVTCNPIDSRSIKGAINTVLRTGVETFRENAMSFFNDSAEPLAIYRDLYKDIAHLLAISGKA